MEESEVDVLAWELVDLATHLRQERLFTISEQENLQQLNNKIAVTSAGLCELAWITWQQRISINKLTGSRPDCSPTSCCHTVNSLDNTCFVQAHKVIGLQESIHVTQLLEFIKHRPVLLAQCLSVGDTILPEKVDKVVDVILPGLYGCCLLPEDKAIALKLLLHLTKLQLINSDDPQRLMRHKSCTFVQLYSSFHEGLYSATLFLTAALHAPIMSLLMEDEKFLDIDPDKTSIRFTSSERLRMFGVEGTPEYTSRIQKYREWTINKLVGITNKFIQSICENIHCFPSSVCWLVRHIYKLLTEAKKLSEKEVYSICADLIFTSFICPAIVNPEAYGIVDITISYVARFNLIQIAKILQMLLMQKYEPIEPKAADLYSHFDNQNNLSIVMNVLLEDATHANSLDEEPSIMDSSSHLKELLQPPAAYFTSQQLSSFINFFQLITCGNHLGHADKQHLLELLSRIPTSVCSVSPLNVSNNTNNNNNATPFSQSPSPNSTPKKSTNILTKAVNKAKLSSASLITDDHASPENSVCNGNIQFDHSNGIGDHHQHINSDDSSKKRTETVLIFTFSSKTDVTLGLLSEEQVLKSCHVLNKTEDEDEVISNHVNNVQQPSQVVQFSLSHSQDEGVSEAASNHSEESSMELEPEDQNDNLSDMISANVSGRGSPNISGRDTPSSQIAENYDAANAEEVHVPTPPPRAVKQTRFDLDDKFGKFEIKNMIHSGDETVSLVSDTWSTDVLASDSENIEQNQNAAQNILMTMSVSESNPFILNTISQLPDISETASEAWSTDVMASDSDRVTEVDTDDTASVARSDITTGTRSEIESRGEPDTSEDVLSSQTCLASSSSYVQEESVVHSVEKSFNFKHPFPSTPRSTNINSSVTFSSHHISCIKSNIVAPGNLEAQDHLSNIDNDLQEVTEQIVKADSGIDNDEKIGIKVEVSRSSSNSVISESVTTVVETSFTKTVDSCDGLTERSGNTVLSNGSVVSVNDISSRSVVPSSLRSPIIKSISFDKTAEKGDKDLLDEDGKTKRSFFKNIKLAFKKPRGKSFRFDQWNDVNSPGVVNGCPSSSSVIYHPSEDETSAIRFSSTELPKLKQPSLQIYPLCDTSEDILAKYRPKSVNVTEFNSNKSKTKETKDVDNHRVNDVVIQQDNVSGEFEAVFDNVKRKLRLVLSTAEIQQLPCPANNNDYSIPTMTETWYQHQNILVAFLQSQLAEAINLKDRPLIAHLHETLRCVRAFDNKRCWKLLESLKEDYKNRALYLSYLMRCRQTLLSAVSRIERLVNRIKCEQSVCKHFLTLLCVRLFIQKWESQMVQFGTEFQKLTLADEKNDFLNRFLNFLYGQLEDDPSWQGVTEQQLEQARTSIERIVIARVYFYAMYPNGDGDISRDQVLHEHIRKLSRIITPNHKDLKITSKYHNECPWPSAQEELIAITAFKTPQDKLKCVLRCTQTIVNLLSFVSSTAPSADHLVPVLVYVLIKANPPSLLSTIQYINSFYSSRLCGEDHYWWVQFCSAVEFIKTMDYGA